MNKAALVGLTPYGAVPTPRQLQHLSQFSKKAFFHFGVNTFTDLEWGNGNEDTSVFNPTDTDVRQWIKVIKAAGFTMAILTVKHHDGFCLWPSKYNDHNISNSPYKNGKGDLVREFTDACHEMDVAVGIYLSPWDRNSKLWGKDEYSLYYNDQLRELMTNYGKINEVWWDAAGSTETRYDWGLWAHTVRNLQPEAALYGSFGATPYVEMRWIGNESGYAADPHYSTLFTHTLEIEDTQKLVSGEFGGDIYVPAEVDVSIRPGWFYHPEQDDAVKTPEKLVRVYLDSVGKSSIMLLNFPPDRRGLIPDADANNAIKAHQIISSSFSVNLAAGGKAVADSVRHPLTEPDMMLVDDYDSFYAASDENQTPVVEITLPEKKLFDCLCIAEYVEMGLRVRGFKVEALVEDKWVELADKKSIGYKRILNFAPTLSDKVRLSFYDTATAPVIREFSLHKMSVDIFEADRKVRGDLKNAKDLCKLSTATVTYEGKTATVNFGGIYPFNTVRFNGGSMSRYTFYAFDGSKYYEIHQGIRPVQEEIVRLESTVDTSYQFRIESNRPLDETLGLEIYEL